MDEAKVPSKDRFRGVGRGGSLGDECTGCEEEKKGRDPSRLETGVLKNDETGVEAKVEGWSCSMSSIQFESMWLLMLDCFTALPQIGHETILDGPLLDKKR